MILQIPPSVNHMYINANKNGISYKVYSKKAKEWHDQALYEIKGYMQKNKIKTYNEKIILEIYYYFPDARKRDTHNTLKILCDTLERAGFISNDSLLLPRIMNFEIDRNNPRIEIKAVEHGRMEAQGNA
jgi:crossover junction endodeoxyribonuclease RusA